MRPQITNHTIKCIVIALSIFACRTASAALELKSPDGKLVVRFDLKTVGELKNRPVYSLSFQGRPVLADSRLGLELSDGPLNSDFKIADEKSSTADSTWKPVLAERQTIRDHFTPMVVYLQETRPPSRRLQLIFRAYDEGAAFCYPLPAQTGLTNFTIIHETTQ